LSCHIALHTSVYSGNSMVRPGGNVSTQKFNGNILLEFNLDEYVSNSMENYSKLVLETKFIRKFV